MNCTRIRSRLDLYAGDDLAGREAAEVEAHLRACLTCYREYVELRDLLICVRGAQRPASVERARTAGAAGPDHADHPDHAGDTFVRGVMRQIQGPPPPAPRILERLALVSGWAAAIVLGVSLGWGALARGGAGDAVDAGRDGMRSEGLRPRVVDSRGDNDSALRSIEHADRDHAEHLRGLDLDTQFVNDLERLRGTGPAKSPPGTLMPRPVEVGPSRRIRDF